MADELKDKPLVEALLEIRWKLQGTVPGTQRDPNNRLLLARLSDRLLKDYPVYEELPAAKIPDGFIGHVLQHRFRVGTQKWPLIQIGPGMFTVNSTADYTWDDFRPRVLSAVNALYEAHPKVAELQISNLTLRYIDAIDFDYMEHNAFTFIQENLKAQFSLSEELFSGTNVSNKPCGFTWQTSFQCERPLGRITLRFAAGQKQNIPSIIWETIVESAGDDIPKMPAEFEEWIDLAHDLTHNWFFKMIDGELLRRFKGV